MTSITKMIEAAEAAGFVLTECVHPTPKGKLQHVVLDYPGPLGDKLTVTPIWRIHTDPNKVPHVTVIAHRNMQRRVSLVTAIVWAQRIAAENPKT